MRIWVEVAMTAYSPPEYGGRVVPIDERQRDLEGTDYDYVNVKGLICIIQDVWARPDHPTVSVGKCFAPPIKD